MPASRVHLIESPFANLYSVGNALRYLGYEPVLVATPEQLEECQLLIFPGVGSFGAVSDFVRQRGLLEPLRRIANAGTPVLGICLGMQLLFECGFEGGQASPGLGLLAGEVLPLPPDRVPQIPHMGWNSLDAASNPWLDGKQVYFVHSFYCHPLQASDVLATTRITEDFAVPAMVGRGNVLGMQFHPERSGKVGLDMLEHYLSLDGIVAAS
jgi:glutamine amidotransferase